MIPCASEHHDMVALAQWLDLRRVLWCSIPNGGYRPIHSARIIKAEGAKKGAPDLLIFNSPPRVRRVCGSPFLGCALELKRAKGGRLSDDQVLWLDSLQKLGWYTIVALGFDDAIDGLIKAGY